MVRRRNKNQKNQQPSKRKSRRPQNRKRGGGMTMSITPALNRAVHQVCSNFDPFCQSAMGAKLFDENTQPSLTYQSRQVIPITTDANGLALFYLNNSAQKYYGLATIAAGVTTAWTSTNSDFFNTIGTAGIAGYRVVSTGCRFFTTQSWTTATGYVIVTETSDPKPDIVGLAVSSTRLGPKSKVLALRDATITVVGRSKGMQARNYKPFDEVESGYTGSYYFFNGAASTTVGFMEMVTNYEWTADPGSSYQYFASPAAEHKPAILNAVTDMSAVNSNIKTFSAGIESLASFMSEAKSAVHKTAGLIEDVGAIGGMISPGARGIAAGAHALRLLTN
jgi:hypothetical protein